MKKTSILKRLKNIFFSYVFPLFNYLFSPFRWFLSPFRWLSNLFKKKSEPQQTKATSQPTSTTTHSGKVGETVLASPVKVGKVLTVEKESTTVNTENQENKKEDQEDQEDQTDKEKISVEGIVPSSPQSSLEAKTRIPEEKTEEKKEQTSASPTSKDFQKVEISSTSTPTTFQNTPEVLEHKKDEEKHKDREEDKKDQTQESSTPSPALSYLPFSQPKQNKFSSSLLSSPPLSPNPNKVLKNNNKAVEKQAFANPVPNLPHQISRGAKTKNSRSLPSSPPYSPQSVEKEAENDGPKQPQQATATKIKASSQQIKRKLFSPTKAKKRKTIKRQQRPHLGPTIRQYINERRSEWNFKNCRFGDSRVIKIAKELKQQTELNQIKVTKINFVNNKIHDKGIIELLKVLESNTAVKEIILSKNLFGMDGIRALVAFLTKSRENSGSENTSALEHLKLNGNAITNEGAIELANALVKNRTLKVLSLRNLRNNNNNNETVPLGDEALSAFADALKSNTTLEELSIDSNGNQSTLSIAKALASNRTLASLHLGRCSMKYEKGGPTQKEVLLALKESLKENRTLRELTFEGCPIDDEENEVLWSEINEILDRNKDLYQKFNKKIRQEKDKENENPQDKENEAPEQQAQIRSKLGGESAKKKPRASRALIFSDKSQTSSKTHFTRGAAGLPSPRLRQTSPSSNLRNGHGLV